MTRLKFEYRPMPDLGQPLRERLGNYPRVPDLTLDALRTVARWLVVGTIKVLFRIEVVGAFPDLPRVALVANHRSHLDALAVLASLPERRRRDIACLAAKDYFFARLSGALAGSLFGMAVAFDRTHYTELRRWSRILEGVSSGWLLVFPSGSRRRAEAHDAILFVLAKSGWPIVPVALSGTARAWPVGSFPRPFRRVRLVIGAPLAAADTKAISAQLADFWKEHA